MRCLIALACISCCLLMAEAATTQWPASPTFSTTAPLPEPKSILVGSFNLWIFGQTKLKKQNVTDVILKIIQKYDLVALQEIRDVSNYSANELKRLIQEKDDDYEFVASNHLGRSSSKEQYSYFYRKSKLTLTGEYQYDDTKEDNFERPPYVARFSTKVDYPYGSIDIAFANIHTKPETTVWELGNMTKVYDDIFWKWQPAVVLFGGDMNADCNYVSKSKWSQIPFWTNSTFVWLIDNTTDTTQGKENCAYDRFVAVGQKLLVSMIPNTAKSWLYYKDMGLTLEEAGTVSDHYPIEFEVFSNWFYPPKGSL